MANGYTYTVYATDATSLEEIATAGYPQGKTSTDGSLIIVDNQCNSEPTQTTVPTKPAYVVETMSNWPYINHTEARQLFAYQATSNGASDGYYYNNVGA